MHRLTSEHGLASPRSQDAASGGLAVNVDDVDAHYERACTAGARIDRPTGDQPYGRREYGARDSKWPRLVVGNPAEGDGAAVAMMTISEARELALALPETVEQDHHGIPSLRVRGKIFATVPDRDHLRIMVNEGDILAAVAENPAACQEFWWGSRLACVVVDLRSAPGEIVVALLLDAWRRKAPLRVIRDFDSAANRTQPLARQQLHADAD